jgi:hypothetical protein
VLLAGLSLAAREVLRYQNECVSEILGEAARPHGIFVEFGSRLLPILLISARRAMRHTHLAVSLQWLIKQNVKPYSPVECYKPYGNNGCCLNLVALFLGLLFDPEDGGSTILRNVCKLLPIYTASHSIHAAVRISNPT